MKQSDLLQIDFEPIGKRIRIKSNQSVLEAAQMAGIQITALCGGNGTCGACKIRLMSGTSTPLSDTEKKFLSEKEIKENYRLACKAFPKSDLKIYVPPESLSTSQRLQLEGIKNISDSSDCIIQRTDLCLSQPTLSDPRSDLTRIKEGLSENGHLCTRCNYNILESLSDSVRRFNWKFCAVQREDELIAILPSKSRILGLAIDIGSTKIAAYLVDLEMSAVLSKKGITNPQISYGEDVVTRIAYADSHPHGREILQEKLITALNNLIRELCTEVGEKSEQIVEIVAVCNTAIHHFFLNLPVRQLGVMPFIPAITDSINVPAVKLGLDVAPGAYVYLPNNVAGYIGADHVAMLLATGIHKSSKTEMALDIGTNTEISLSHKGKIYSCSCASGPAFEGAHIQNGMRASTGAIEKAQMIDGEMKVQTIDQEKAIGICGSGILDIVGSLRESGVINERGNFNRQVKNVRPAEKNYEYVLVNKEDSGTDRDITVTRFDINEIILAKSAIRTGIDILLKEANLQPSDIEEFIVAGAFGTYLSVENAIRIGMFPDISIERYRQVGNAAGTGAIDLLLSKSLRAECDKLCKRINYIELTSYPDFRQILVDNMRL